MSEPADGRFLLNLSCADRPCIVHAVAGFLVDHGGNILASQQFGDPDTGPFFMRVEFETAVGADELGHSPHVEAPDRVAALIMDRR